jgi:hypothetical protein
VTVSPTSCVALACADAALDPYRNPCQTVGGKLFLLPDGAKKLSAASRAPSGVPTPGRGLGTHIVDFSPVGAGYSGTSTLPAALTLRVRVCVQPILDEETPECGRRHTSEFCWVRSISPVPAQSQTKVCYAPLT